jgi:hypothetical protein
MHAGEYLGRWLAQIPELLSEDIRLLNPLWPTRTGTDAASFICSGAPVFSLLARNGDWEPGLTQHTTSDTFDKIIPEAVRANATLLAMLVYLADQDPQRMPRDRRVMSEWEGAVMTWPECPSR